MAPFQVLIAYSIYCVRHFLPQNYRGSNLVVLYFTRCDGTKIEAITFCSTDWRVQWPTYSSKYHPPPPHNTKTPLFLINVVTQLSLTSINRFFSLTNQAVHFQLPETFVLKMRSHFTIESFIFDFATHCYKLPPTEFCYVFYSISGTILRLISCFLFREAISSTQVWHLIAAQPKHCFLGCQGWQCLQCYLFQYN